jgi:hypothetical protein
MIRPFWRTTSDRTREYLPCGPQGRENRVELFRKSNSKFWWYDFTVRGKRYRASTKETNEHRAAKIASLKLAAAIEGSDPVGRKAPPLRDAAQEFLDWLDGSRLADDTKRYYRNGWRLLEQTPLAPGSPRPDHDRCDRGPAIPWFWVQWQQCLAHAPEDIPQGS